MLLIDQRGDRSKFADQFVPALQYTDTARDKEVLKALIVELTSVMFAAKLQCIRSRRGTSSAKTTLHSSLSNDSPYFSNCPK